MDQYKTGRILARIIGAIGWLMAAICAFFFVYRLVRTHPATWSESFPLLVMIAVALSLVLLSWIARAVFDMASARSGHGA